MTNVTFYHSMICPRCRLVSISLAGLLPQFPSVSVQKIEYLTHPRRARQAGVRAIPTLVCGDRMLSGFYLTKGRLRAFLEAVAAEGRDSALPA